MSDTEIGSCPVPPFASHKNSTNVILGKLRICLRQQSWFSRPELSSCPETLPSSPLPCSQASLAEDDKSETRVGAQRAWDPMANVPHPDSTRESLEVCFKPLMLHLRRAWYRGCLGATMRLSGWFLQVSPLDSLHPQLLSCKHFSWPPPTLSWNETSSTLVILYCGKTLIS